MNAKRMLTLSLILMLLLSAAACQKDTPAGGTPGTEAPSPTEAPTEAPTTTPDAPVQNDGYEKFCQLKLGMTEEDVTAILGEPSRVDKAYHYYPVMVNGQEIELEVWINTVSGLVVYITGDFYQTGVMDAFADSATDFSAVDGLDSGELATYEDCAAAFKTPGYLIGLDEDGITRYLWVNTTGGHLSVSFRADGTVRSYTGYC